MKALLEEIVNSETVDDKQLVGLAYNTTYYVWYQDPFLLGGAVTYQDSTVKSDAMGSGDNLFVGSITTPRAGAPDTTGNGDGGSGAQFGMVTIIGFTEESAARVQVGNGSVVNPWNMVDGDPTSSGTLNVSGNGALNKAAVTLHPSAGVSQRYTAATLNLNLAVPTNSLAGGSDPTVVSVSYSLLYDQGTFTGIFSLAPGVTAARQTVSVSLPPNINLSQVTLSIQAACVTETSGSLQVVVYEATIEAQG